MKNSETVRRQFDRQADHFDAWSVPKNIEYLTGISDFIALKTDDVLLDVATGTGDFPIFVASKIKSAVGVDVSEAMIDRAINNAQQRHIPNITFKAMDAGSLAFSDASFSVVNSKSALHHMSEYETAFEEMVRCCRPGGKISVCDIIAFKDPRTDAFFEKIEKAVDASHFRTLGTEDIKALYLANGISIDKCIDIEIEHSLSEYLSHAVQSEQDLRSLASLVAEAEGAEYLNGCWTPGADPKFRKRVLLILGTRPV